MAQLPPIHEDWLHGVPVSLSAILPMVIARQQLSDWDEKRIRATSNEILRLFDDWKKEFGENPKPVGLLSLERNKEDAEAWECAGYLVNDPLDLLQHLANTQYRPIRELSHKHSKTVLLSIMILEELAEDSRLRSKFKPPNIPHNRIEAALKGALIILSEENRNIFQMAEQYVQETSQEIKDRAENEAILKQTRKAAQKKNEKYALLKKRAIELYNSGSYKSIRQCAFSITDTLREYGKKELGHWLSTDDPVKRVYDWLLDANKKGLLKNN